MSFGSLSRLQKVAVAVAGGLGGGYLLKRYADKYVEHGKILVGSLQADKDSISRAEEGFKKLQDASECKSLLKKHLTKSVLDKCKGRMTKNGGTLWHVMRSGVQNLDSGVGLYASDPDSYYVFKELFDPVIEDYHQGFGPKAKQPATDLGEGKLDYFKELDPEHKYIQSTRIRCGRTIKGFNFNPLMREDDYFLIEGRVKDALNNIPDSELKGTYYPLKGMTKETQNQLIKDHFLFKEGDRFLQATKACEFWPSGRGIFHNKDKTFLIWLNEEDHMRIISMQPGGDVKTVLDRLIRGVKSIEKQVPFHRDDRLGWLTFCPSNLGTTVRASVHIKLPKVSARKDFKEICEKMNLQIRGIHGEHSESAGGVYDVSNKRRMGLTEYEAVKEMYDGVKKLIEMEAGSK